MPLQYHSKMKNNLKLEKVGHSSNMPTTTMIVRLPDTDFVGCYPRVFGDCFKTLVSEYTNSPYQRLLRIPSSILMVRSWRSQDC